MKLRNILILSAIFSLSSAFAQVETTDSLEQNVITPRTTHIVHSTSELKDALVVDTLPTGNDAVSIVLYNDNTWRYVRNRAAEKDLTLFTKYWSHDNVVPYREVPLDSLPKTIDIELVDSLHRYHYPITGRVTSRYGVRHYRPHNGIDIALKIGDPIYATFDGKVRMAKVCGGYGKLVVIRHDNGLETYYGHLSKIMVEPDQYVTAGQVIALGGNTGRSTGPHLHFEFRYYGQSFDPERLIDFSTGDLSRDIFILRKTYFSIFSKNSQNFEDEIAEEEAIKKAEAAARAQQYHTIRRGDTLSGLAVKYHTSIGKICQLNGISKNKTLQVGKRLRVR